MTERQAFSNGKDFENWYQANCRHCEKCTPGGKFFLCKIEEELVRQDFHDGKISLQAYLEAQSTCPEQLYTEEITHKMKTLKEKWAEVCNEYLEAFCKKHKLSFEYWVGSDIGNIAEVGDYFVNIHDIRYDIDNDIPEEKFFQWYDYTAELGFLGLERTINYENFCKGAPLPYSEEEVEKIKRLHEAASQAVRALQDEIDKYEKEKWKK